MHKTLDGTLKSSLIKKLSIFYESLIHNLIVPFSRLYQKLKIFERKIFVTLLFFHPGLGPAYGIVMTASSPKKHVEPWNHKPSDILNLERENALTLVLPKLGEFRRTGWKRATSFQPPFEIFEEDPGQFGMELRKKSEHTSSPILALNPLIVFELIAFADNSFQTLTTLLNKK
ncbi:hypothetical protein BpHYR1_048008 [Brachionus plicatilis]|uniref:Uncharacterized protein n=1 Tax=Brachionus plicatilis TaxID=10195 RepID=A0A3M7T9I1_BRAPC|nr:hypothetical protein BpHYR1_048008 [Brachionus plicatilis]